MRRMVIVRLSQKIREKRCCRYVCVRLFSFLDLFLSNTLFKNANYWWPYIVYNLNLFCYLRTGYVANRILFQNEPWVCSKLMIFLPYVQDITANLAAHVWMNMIHWERTARYIVYGGHVLQTYILVLRRSQRCGWSGQPWLMWAEKWSGFTAERSL